MQLPKTPNYIIFTKVNFKELRMFTELVFKEDKQPKICITKNKLLFQ